MGHISRWSVLQFDLGDDEVGYLLERDAVVYARDGRVPAFASREAALAFARELDPTVEAVGDLGSYDLKAIEAFVDRRAATPPPASLEVWSLLDEVAAAADRRVAPAVGGTSLTEPLRLMLATGLVVFRDVVTHVS
jgi:hypothetical protein